MRSNTLRLALVLAALAAAGCKKEGVEGPQAACRPVSSACSADSDCCSYGCLLGSCRQNPLEGGACRTTDDCVYPHVCVDQACTASVTCRPGGTSCVYGADCCSGQCAGTCAVDLGPTAVIWQGGASVETLPDQPFTVPLALDGGHSTDPNTGAVGLLYEWSVLSAPAGSTAAPSTPTLSTTSFTPDVPSLVTPYVLQLRVTKGGLSGTDTLTFRAVNTLPAIAMPADILTPSYQSRNVALTTTANVSDADGGPITCSWTKTAPDGVTVTEISPPTVCAGASGQAAVGTSTPPALSEDEAGIWKLTLTATDGVNTVTKDRFVNVQNDPPVANAGPKRWGNYGLGAIPIDGTATDVNGDVTNGNQGDGTFTWLWTVTVAPAGSPQLGTTVGTTPSIAFLPQMEGLYTLTLSVDDGHGGPNGDSSTSTVDVQVEPYILPVGEVADAEYVENSSPERLVLVQTDTGNAYKLSVVDPATLEITVEVTLAARPIALALNFTPPAQSEAIVAEAGGIFQHVTGLPSAPVVAHTSATAVPAEFVDVVHAGTYAYGLTTGGTVYLLDPVGTSGSWWTTVSCPTCGTTPVGTRAAGGMTGSGTTPTIWLMQGGSPGGLARYDVHSNGNLQNQVTNPAGTFAGATGLWLSADGADVYTTRTSVFDALSATLAQRATTSLQYTPSHLDTALSGGSLEGAIAQYGTASLAPFSRTTVGGAFTFGTVKAYPFLGMNGDQITNYGRFAFVKSGGGGYYAVVRANVGTDASPIWKWGVVNLGP